MAHQCLQCGKLFDAGSKEVLRGCASCGGTKFFFTKQALTPSEREAMMAKANADLRTLVQELMAAGKPDYGDPLWSREKWAEWVKLDLKSAEHRVQNASDGEVRDVEEELLTLPRDHLRSPRLSIHSIADVMKKPPQEPQNETASASPAAQWPPALPGPESEAPRSVNPESAPPHAPEAPSLAPAGSSSPRKPETIQIPESGRYEIDLEALLRDSPIVVQKDGVYMVHLPSAFANAAKGDA